MSARYFSQELVETTTEVKEEVIIGGTVAMNNYCWTI